MWYKNKEIMKLIQTKDYLLLINEEAQIKEGSIAIYDFGMGYDLEIPCDKDNLKSNTRKLVVAYYPLTKEAKDLDLPLLPNHLKEINNGWIKIESENIILPIDGTEVHFYHSFINENGIQNEYHKGIFNAALGFTSYYDSENYKVKEVTHYQPIEKQKPPIY